MSAKKSLAARPWPSVAYMSTTVLQDSPSPPQLNSMIHEIRETNQLAYTPPEPTDVDPKLPPVWL